MFDRDPRIGDIDFIGREIVYIAPGGALSATRDLKILLTKKGNLLLVSFTKVKPVILKKENSLVFRIGSWAASFSLKGAGREYQLDNDIRHGISFKMDYDEYGNMFITPLQRKRTYEKQLFMSKIWIAAIKYKRDRLRKKLKLERIQYKGDHNDKRKK